MSDSMQKQLTIERLREQLAQAEADRDVLAAEVRALRKVFDDHDNWSIPFSTIQRIHKIQDATDASGALQRAKEAK